MALFTGFIQGVNSFQSCTNSDLVADIKDIMNSAFEFELFEVSLETRTFQCLRFFQVNSSNNQMCPRVCTYFSFTNWIGTYQSPVFMIIILFRHFQRRYMCGKKNWAFSWYTVSMNCWDSKWNRFVQTWRAAFT